MATQDAHVTFRCCLIICHGNFYYDERETIVILSKKYGKTFEVKDYSFDSYLKKFRAIEVTDLFFMLSYACSLRKGNIGCFDI